MNILELFKRLGALIWRAINAAEASGLTDQIVEMALPLVLRAAVELATNEARREWVVATLIANGIPESVSRIAVELAVQIVKRGM